MKSSQISTMIVIERLQAIEGIRSTLDDDDLKTPN